MLRTHYIWGDPLRGRGKIEPDPSQLPPRAGGRMLRCGGWLVWILDKLISFYMQLIAFCVLTYAFESPIT